MDHTISYTHHSVSTHTRIHHTHPHHAYTPTPPRTHTHTTHTHPPIPHTHTHTHTTHTHPHTRHTHPHTHTHCTVPWYIPYVITNIRLHDEMFLGSTNYRKCWVIVLLVYKPHVRWEHFHWVCELYNISICTLMIDKVNLIYWCSVDVNLLTIIICVQVIASVCTGNQLIPSVIISC